MNRKKSTPSNNSDEGLTKRLDALIRMAIESRYAVEKDFSETKAARTLKSVGLTPTEIAGILGKKSATDVSPYLYPKKSGNNRRNTSQTRDDSIGRR